jgi:O-antigen/teichoic acid export membrane protein
MWRYFRTDFLIYAFSKVLVGISSFVVLRLVTNAMQPEQYGSYSLIFAVVTIATTVVVSYLTNSIIRYLPLASEQKRLRAFDHALAQISTPTALVALGVTTFGLLAVLGLELVHVEPAAICAALVASVAASAFQIYSIYCYSGRRRMLYAAITIVQMSSFMLGAMFVRWLPFDPVTATLTIMALSYILTLAAFRMPWPSLNLRPSRPARQLLGRFLRYGGPLVALNISIQLNTYLDQFMLRSMRSLEEVGLYAANYVVADKVIYALSSVVAITIAPLVFTEWERRNPQASLQMLWKSIAVFLAIGAPVFFIVIALADPIMTILTGPDYAEGRVILPFVLGAALLSGTSSLLAYVHSLMERTVELSVIYFAGLAVNFVCNVVLIPNLGLVGCAISTLAAQSVVFVILLARGQMLCKLLEHCHPAMASLIQRRP